MTIQEIDKQIAALQEERKRLCKEKLEMELKSAETFVGRCFCAGGEYAKVLGAPEQQWDEFFHSYYNTSELPALIIDIDDDEPFSFYTINPKYPGWKEISQEEFNAEFEKAVVRLRERAGISL